MPRLILNPGRADERTFDLSPGPNTIGRAEDNLVFILDRSLSRHHASVDVNEDGAVLPDLGSTNGTFVNDEKIETARSRRQRGDPLRRGAAALRPGPTQTETDTHPTHSRDIDADLTRLSMRDILETPLRQIGSAEERLRILLKVSQLLASPASSTVCWRPSSTSPSRSWTSTGRRS